MEDYSWEELTELYEACLNLPLKKQKSYILKHTVHNPSLKDRLIKMLEQANESENYFANLKKGIAEGLEINLPDLATPGDLINNYKIIGKIGVGGSSQVYVAERVDGQFDKKVAIKIFKKEASSSFAEKNSQEKQFMASLSHPAIAQIFDAGTLANGHPFIIMELIDGETIQQFLKNNTVNEKAGLKMFSNICTAVREAHSNLILHLDIKPSNVVIEKSSRIKLLDFGIAQHLKKSISNENLSKLTFNFAAPEQLNRQQLSVQTDIYQLGLLLYYILSNGQLLKSHKEVLRVLSSRTSTIIRSEELLAIIQKCLQQSAEKRYSSVDELLSDVRNFQEHFPVITYSNNWTYRTEKYLKRNSLASVLITLVFLSMLIGTIISLRQAKRAQENQELAYKQRDRAEAISSFLISFFESPNPRSTKELGKDFTVKEFLKIGQDKVQTEFDSLPILKVELAGIISDMYDKLGYREESLALEETLLSQYKRILGDTSERYFDSQLRMARIYSETGKVKKADSIYTAALKVIKKHTYYSRGNALTEYGLYALNVEGNIKKADSLVNLSIEIFQENQDTLRKQFVDALSVLGTINNRLGLFEKASDFYQRELLIKQKINTNDPVDIALTQSNLATIFLQTNNPDKALNLQKEALDTLIKNLGIEHIHSLHALNNLSHTYLMKYNYDSAKHISNKCTKLYRSVLGLTSYETGYIYLNNAFYDINEGQYDSAQYKIDLASAIFKKSLPPNHYLNSLVSMYQSQVLMYTHEIENALQETYKAENYLINVIPETNFLWGILYNRRGTSLFLSGQFEEAETNLLKSFEILKVAKGVDNYITQSAILRLCDLYAAKGNRSKEEKYFAILTDEFLNSALYKPSEVKTKKRS